jgi:hypothetical protein
VNARRRFASLAAALSIFALMASAALAVQQVHDKIQVYNAEINEIGQWSYQRHLNFAGVSQTQPEFPGGFTLNHSLFAVTGTGESLSGGPKSATCFLARCTARSPLC